MSVIIDMVLAVAMVALAPGTVAELQFRISHIGAAADGAFVGVGRLGLGHRGLVGAGVGERDGLCFWGGLGILPEKPPGVHSPGHGEDIENILTKEQEIVGQGDDREQIVGEGVNHKAEGHYE